MKLFIKDRLILSSILPKKGDYTSMVVRSDIEKKVIITQEEIRKLGFAQTENGFKWKLDKDKGIEIEFSELELKMIKGELKKLDESKSLDSDTFELYKIFNV